MTIQKSMFGQNVCLVYDNEQTYDLKSQYVYFLHGCEYRAQGPFFGVLAHIQETRDSLTRDRTHYLDPNALVFLYAGNLTEDSLERIRRKHMRQFVMDGLHRIASGSTRAPGAASASVRALKLLDRLSNSRRHAR